jgi:uncharacterized protein (DUF4415 family)
LANDQISRRLGQDFIRLAEFSVLTLKRLQTFGISVGTPPAASGRRDRRDGFPVCTSLLAYRRQLAGIRWKAGLFVATIKAKSARIAMPGFRSHEPAALGRPLGLSQLGLSYRLADLGQKPHLTADPAPALNKGARPKAEGPKVHIGFRLAADVVASLKASGPGYNARVEEALRKAGFGAAKKAAAKGVPPAKRRA